MLNPHLLEGMAAERERDLRADAQGGHYRAPWRAMPARRHANMVWWRIAPRRLVTRRAKSPLRVDVASAIAGPRSQ